MFELVEVWAAASKQCPASQSYSSVKLLYVSSPCILSSPSVTHLSPVLSPALFRLMEFPAVLTIYTARSRASERHNLDLYQRCHYMTRVAGREDPHPTCTTLILTLHGPPSCYMFTYTCRR
jgi:hypothetical protein